MSDNLVAITTNFLYCPLVTQLAGAGGDVTATGLLVTVCNALTANSKARDDDRKALLWYSFSFTSDGQTLHRLESALDRSTKPYVVLTVLWTTIFVRFDASAFVKFEEAEMKRMTSRNTHTYSS
jgi:tryptophan-rich sensory protein